MSVNRFIPPLMIASTFKLVT
uniref:Uncharacterized protein n=1 Tax=Amphimedon queenslandica TaxID=400682 RepID=A0A1X7U5D4_AMPQE